MSTPCAHCGTLVEAEAGPVYCCSGCELAYQLISEAGLSRYYAEREALPDRPGAPVRGWTGVPVQNLPGGACRAEVFLDGLHCASCVWVSEKVLGATPGVQRAAVSYATGKAELVWDPTTTNLDTICGRVSALGYRPRPLQDRGGPDRDLVVRLGVAAFAAGNIMMFAVPIYLGWFEGMAEKYAALFRWCALALATPVALWAAIPFYRGALAGLRARVPHVDLPVSLGIVALYAHGLVATLRGQDSYLDSLSMLVALLLAGRVIDQGRRRRSVDAALALAAEAPRIARRRTATGLQDLSPDALAVGDLIEIASGEEIACDGLIVEGRGSVASALLTGESAPRPQQPGDRVVAGALLVEGNLTVRVESVAAESLLMRMAAALRDAVDRPAEPTPADRIAPAFTAATLGLASLTWLGHAAGGHFGPDALDAAWKATIAVLVVACPCALALSGPLATASGLGAAARRGLLLRSGDALRRLASVDLVVLDKTGTLTGGQLEVVSAEDAVLRVVAGLEARSVHPIARAIVAEAARRGLALPRGEEVAELAGRGMVGRIDGQTWTVAAAGAGQVGLWRGAAEGEPTGRITLRDRPRPDAARAVARLRAQGLPVVLLSGDHADVARAIGAEAGVDRVIAEADPERKVAVLAGLAAEGRRVLYVGDGLNDGPALQAAHVGVAMASGVASSLSAADGVVAQGALQPLVAGLASARVTAQTIQSGLYLSVAYNALAVLAAALGYVNPLVAAVLMPLSSAMVVTRAARVEGRVARALQTPPPAAGATLTPAIQGA